MATTTAAAAATSTRGVPDIPRARWPEHPRFPEQALLLGSHDSFRRYCRYIHDGVVAVGTEAGSVRRKRRLIARMAAHYVDLRWSMSVHERYEERKLYPFLEQRYGVVLGWLREEHDELALLDELVRDAFVNVDALAPDADEQTFDASRRAVLDALEAHETVLDVHLRSEEDTVIPLLLALDAETFAHYRELAPVAPWPRPRTF